MAALSSIDSGLPFGDFRALIERLPPLDERAAARVRDDFGRIEGSKDSLSEKVAAWLAASTGRPPAVLRPVVTIFAGNHGIARHGVSPRPVEATQRFVELAVAGGAGVNQVCAAHGLGLSFTTSRSTCRLPISPQTPRWTSEAAPQPWHSA
jgi:nicotinate-nucleotide--dimethylbenzimidazole phosphoribosyltransferase